MQAGKIIVGVCMDADNYLENYIIAETKETYRINSFWHYWAHRGLMAAMQGDDRIVLGWRIVE